MLFNADIRKTEVSASAFLKLSVNRFGIRIIYNTTELWNLWKEHYITTETEKMDGDYT